MEVKREVHYFRRVFDHFICRYEAVEYRTGLNPSEKTLISRFSFSRCLPTPRMALRTTITTVLLVSSAFAAPPHKGWQQPYAYPGGGPTATIDAGVVIGTTTSLPAATATVNKFLGVPFAKSPPIRFAPPESPGTFEEAINAPAWKPACIQQFMYPREAYEFTREIFNVGTHEESEDCLCAVLCLRNEEVC